jgi:hypothetical protein
VQRHGAADSAPARPTAARAARAAGSHRPRPRQPSDLWFGGAGGRRLAGGGVAWPFTRKSTSLLFSRTLSTAARARSVSCASVPCRCRYCSHRARCARTGVALPRAPGLNLFSPAPAPPRVAAPLPLRRRPLHRGSPALATVSISMARSALLCACSMVRWAPVAWT